MSNYLFLLLLLACPLVMVFMMRGMHGGNDAGHQPESTSHGSDARDERLAELEREVTELRAEREPERPDRR